MADDVAINITGIVETQRAIYQFSERLGDRVTLLALRAGANYMLKKVREAAPKNTGRLKRATVTANSRINRRRLNGKVGVYVTVKPGKRRDDPRGAYYAGFVERGYKRGATVIPGRKFVSSTFHSSKAASLDIILAAIERGGSQLAAEISRR